MDLLRAKDTQNSQICWISTQQRSHPSILEETSDFFSWKLGVGVFILPLVLLEDWLES